MKLSKEQISRLNKIKKEVEKQLQKDETYLKLDNREQEILKSLKDNKCIAESKKLLEEYRDIGKKINEIEIHTAYKITIKETEKNVLINFFEKIISKNKGNSRYQNEFNKISEDNDYKKIVKRHNDIFKQLIKKLRENEELLYELESIETQMATIKTEKIREYIINKL